MSRSLIGLAAAAIAGLAIAPGAQAQNVQLYGLLDMSAGRFQAPGGDKVWRADNGDMSTSYIGFKGTEDLGGGLKAKFKIEHFMRLDTGAAGRFNGDAFWARDAYVGLSGAFGTTTLGRNTTPLFVSTLLFNAFGDSFGFSPSIRQLFTPALLPFFGDTGWNNSIAYSSTDYNGLSFNLIANLGEGAPGATGRNVGANVLYFAGPLAATVAWQQVKNGDGLSPTSPFTAEPPGFSNQNTFQLGVSYDLGVAKLFGQYTQVKTSATLDTKTTLWGVGASVPVGAGRVIAQYGSAKAEAGGDTTNKTLSVGYDYNLSKNTDAYAVFMNDKVRGLASGNSLAAGVRLRF
ncbi:MAG TPA: porin [Albitalea sp.]|nr:porin [Albitalea sp.]